MSANEIHINSVTSSASPKPSELPTAPVVSPAKTKSDVKPVNTVSIHDIRRMADIKKDESLNEISENVEVQEYVGNMIFSPLLYFEIYRCENRFTARSLL